MLIFVVEIQFLVLIFVVEIQFLVVIFVHPVVVYVNYVCSVTVTCY